MRKQLSEPKRLLLSIKAGLKWRIDQGKPTVAILVSSRAFALLDNEELGLREDASANGFKYGLCIDGLPIKVLPNDSVSYYSFLEEIVEVGK